jgi:hypothetical protein
MNKYPEACGVAKSETPELERIIDQLNGELSSLVSTRERLYGTYLRFTNPAPTSPSEPEQESCPQTVISRLWAVKDRLRNETKYLQELANNFDKII